MRISWLTKGFRSDYKKLKKQGRKRILKLHDVMDLLVDGMILPNHNRDHPLQGKWNGCRECHIEGDWLLVYQLGINERGQETITFHATGNHEYLFG